MERFEEITVERINVVAPDGSRRLVITNEDRCPPPRVDGQEEERTGGGRAGMIFYNERGDECGGLIFGGSEDEGAPQASALLAFDHFRDDQAVGLVYARHGERTGYGLQMWDHNRPYLSEWVRDIHAVENMDEGPEKERAKAELPPWGETRLFAGRDGDEVLVSIHDRKGRPRIILGLDAEDNPRLDFLDVEGNVMQRLAPQPGAASIGR